jgi:hypothetical protein
MLKGVKMGWCGNLMLLNSNAQNAKTGLLNQEPLFACRVLCFTVLAAPT